MTTATSTPPMLDELDTLVVGDLALRVAPPSNRTTIEIVVERDASLTLKALPNATVERAKQFVTVKRTWVYRKLADKDALTGPPITKQFVEGEGFAYLGRNYRLTLTTDPEATGVRLEVGRFHLAATQAHRGAALMRRWYTETGGQWLRRRIQPWAARLGEQHVEVEVRDLGYRWGSARPTQGPQRTNIHWATSSSPNPHRLRPSPRTSPHPRNQPHPHMLVHRRPPDAQLPTAEGSSRGSWHDNLAGRRRVTPRIAFC